MGDFRSKSYGDGRNPQYHQQNNNYQLEKSYSYAGPRPGFDFPGQGPTQIDFPGPNEEKMKKGRNGSNKNWMIISDPELQRKKRVASYKAYTVEGKVKGGFRKGFRWLKDRYNLVLHGWKS